MGCQASLRKRIRFPRCELLTAVYNCVRIKLTTPRYGGTLWGMSVIIPTGDSHDQEQDSEYDTRISSTRQIDSADCHHIGNCQKYRAQIFATSGTGSHALSPAQSPLQARSI